MGICFAHSFHDHAVVMAGRFDASRIVPKNGANIGAGGCVYRVEYAAVPRIAAKPPSECAGRHATLRGSKTRFDSWRGHAFICSPFNPGADA